MNGIVGQAATEFPLPAGWAAGGLVTVLVAVVGAWLRAVLLAQAAAKEQQDGWGGIVAEKDRQLDRKDREIDRKDGEISKRDLMIERLVLERETACRERDEARAELARERRRSGHDPG